MIIDSHVHIGGNSLFNMTEEAVITSIDRYKIEKCLVSNADSSECDFDQNVFPVEKQCSMYDSLVRTLNFARNNPHRVYVAAWVKPLTEKLDKPFYELVRRNLDIVKAIKIHPYHSKSRFDNHETEKYVRLAQKFKLPVYVHTASDEYSSPELVFEVAKKFPDVIFIMAHLELGSDHKRATSYCAKLPNLYADTAWLPISDAINFVKEVSSEKLLFGSDTPVDGIDTYARNKNGDRSIYQDYFFELAKSISQEDYENIMFKNAQRLFKLN